MTPISWRTKGKGPRLEGQIVGVVVKRFAAVPNGKPERHVTYMIVYMDTGVVVEVPIEDMVSA